MALFLLALFAIASCRTLADAFASEEVLLAVRFWEDGLPIDMPDDPPGAPRRLGTTTSRDFHGRALRARWRGSKRQGWRWYSLGSNGVDEQGQGDDVEVDFNGAVYVLCIRGVCCGLALILLWLLVVSRRLTQARSRSLRLEILRAAATASLPAALAVACALWVVAHDRALQTTLDEISLPRHEPAIVGTCIGVSFLLALAWRLSHPLESVEALEPPVLES